MNTKPNWMLTARPQPGDILDCYVGGDLQPGDHVVVSVEDSWTCWVKMDGTNKLTAFHNGRPLLANDNTWRHRTEVRRDADVERIIQMNDLLMALTAPTWSNDKQDANKRNYVQYVSRGAVKNGLMSVKIGDVPRTKQENIAWEALHDFKIAAGSVWEVLRESRGDEHRLVLWNNGGFGRYPAIELDTAHLCNDAKLKAMRKVVTLFEATCVRLNKLFSSAQTDTDHARNYSTKSDAKERMARIYSYHLGPPVSVEDSPMNPAFARTTRQKLRDAGFRLIEEPYDIEANRGTAGTPPVRRDNDGYISILPKR